jgi:hypothetical protein
MVMKQQGIPASKALDSKSGAFTSIYQYSSGMSSMSMLNQIGIAKIDLLFEEIIKASWEDCKEEDSAEEKSRKLQEKNYNVRIQTHIKDAVHHALLLHSRYSAPLCEPLPYKKALEFANLLQKAYNG